MLNIGDKVRVRSLEWFKKNAFFVSGNKSYVINGWVLHLEMQVLCGEYVTIKDIVSLPLGSIGARYIILHKGNEINCTWIEDFFDLSTAISVNIPEKINDYCSNYCVLCSNGKGCNNLECPLYINFF